MHRPHAYNPSEHAEEEVGARGGARERAFSGEVRER